MSNYRYSGGYYGSNQNQNQSSGYQPYSNQTPVNPGHLRTSSRDTNQYGNYLQTAQSNSQYGQNTTQYSNGTKSYNSNTSSWYGTQNQVAPQLTSTQEAVQVLSALAGSSTSHIGAPNTSQTATYNRMRSTTQQPRYPQINDNYQYTSQTSAPPTESHYTPPPPPRTETPVQHASMSQVQPQRTVTPRQTEPMETSRGTSSWLDVTMASEPTQNEGSSSKAAPKKVAKDQAPKAKPTNDKTAKETSANDNPVKEKRPRQKKKQTTEPEPTDAEKQIRDIMAQIRKMNDTHPSLLAQIWEQERETHLSSQTTAQPPGSAPGQPSPMPASAPCSAKSNSKNKKKSTEDVPPATATTPKSTSRVSKAGEHSPSSSKKKKKDSSTSTANSLKPSKAATGLASLPVISTPTSAAQGLGSSSIRKDVPPSDPRQRSATPASNLKGIVWPADKKEKLSEVAAEYLNKIPDNYGKNVQSSTILALLASDPTYNILCQRVEKLGLTLDRRSFGSTLLSCAENLKPHRANAGLRASIASPQPTSTSQGTWSALNNTTTAPSSSHPHSAAVDASAIAESSEPRTKAEAARKRNIMELMEISDDSDNNRPPPPPPKRPYVFSPPADNKSHPSPAPNSMQPPPIDPQLDLPPHVRRMQSRYATILEERCRNIRLAEPINNSKVARRRQYNVATIARDILLATGKHPSYAPLNQHLEVLKGSLAKYGAPGFRIDNKSDLATIRWDILDPSTPVQVVKRSSQTSNGDVEMKDALNGGMGQKADREASQITQFPSSTVAYETPSAFAVPKKKNGRPPLNRDKDDVQAIIRRYSGPPRTGIPDPQTPAQRNTNSTPKSAPAPIVMPASGESGYAALRAAQALSGAAPRKRGRPVGWRKHIHGKDGGATPAKAQNPVSLPESVPKHHPVFACKWKDCSGKLHNLDTLRKHVQRLHGKANDDASLECHWDGCGRFVRILDQSSGQIVDQHQPLSFSDFDAWSNHVEQSHIGPISWTQGDGPANSFSDGYDSEVSEAYLSDASGRQITPRARVPPEYQNMSLEQAWAIIRSSAYKASSRVEQEMAEHRRLARLKNKEQKDDA